MYEQIERNVWTSRLLLGLFVVLIVGLGDVLGRLSALGYLGLVGARGGCPPPRARGLPTTTGPASCWRSARRGRSRPRSTPSCTTPWRGWPSPRGCPSRASISAT